MILVTGASGFVGGGLLSRLAQEGCAAQGSVRRGGVMLPGGLKAVQVGELAVDTDWREALRGVGSVVHTAARVHVMHDKASDPLAEYRRVNVAGTLNLARQAAKAGVRRFVYISSIKVNGEATAVSVPFRADDKPAPKDAYGQSKLEAEAGLCDIAQDTGMELSIIRPVLVYGFGVQANFAALMNAVRRGLPLPLGAVANQRSLVALENLVDFILLCVHHPRAANQIFLVSDGKDVSTPELIMEMATVLRVQARLVSVPVSWLRALGGLLGRRDAVERLCGNLQVDISKNKDILGWTPPVSIATGLSRVVQGLCD